MANNCEDVKAGDYVFIVSRLKRSLHQVEKITPKGFIKVAGTLFTKDGFMRGGSSYIRTFIYPASAEAVEQYRKEKFIVDVVEKLQRVDNLRYEQAVEINRILFEDGK